MNDLAVPQDHAAAAALFVAVDVHYGLAGARAALVAATDPRFGTIVSTKSVLLPQAEPYRPGEFYLRELPLLRAVCRGVGSLALIVIDGYVDLDPDGAARSGSSRPHRVGRPGDWGRQDNVQGRNTCG